MRIQAWCGCMQRAQASPRPRAEARPGAQLRCKRPSVAAGKRRAWWWRAAAAAMKSARWSASKLQRSMATQAPSSSARCSAATHARRVPRLQRVTAYEVHGSSLAHVL
jgi:hypothetical protein